MSDMYDPYGGDPYAQQAMLSYLYPGQNYDIPTFEMQGKPGGKELPYDIDTYNKVNTAYYKDTNNLMDPSLIALGAMYGMGNVGDYSQFLDQDTSANIPAPQRFTPTYDGLRSGGGPYSAVADMIDLNATPAQINQAIRAKKDEGVLSDEDAKDLMSTASMAQKEVHDFTRSTMDYDSKAAAAKKQPTDLQKTFGKAGLPSPLEQYSADTETVDPGLVGQYQQDRIGELDKRAQAMLAQSQHLGQQAQTDTNLISGQVGQNFGHAPFAMQRPAPMAPPGAAGGPPNLGNRLADAGSAIAGGAQSAWQGFDSGVQNAVGSAADWLTGAEHVDAGLSPDFAANQERHRQEMGITRKPMVPAADKAKKLKSQAMATQKLADQTRTDEGQIDMLRRGRAAQQKTAAGRTPLGDAMAQRQALYQFLRNVTG